MDNGIVAPLNKTVNGTSFFKEPSIGLLATTQTRMEDTVQAFLAQFNPELGFPQYLGDPSRAKLTHGEKLMKFAGQLCYLSFGPKRTLDENVGEYVDNLKNQKHGSVFSHVSASFLFWGISRSLTHEFVRHGVGFAYSQVSTRYVGGETLRFVCRPEFSEDERLYSKFQDRIDRVRKEYEDIRNDVEYVMREHAAKPGTDKTVHRIARKKMNQAARAVLTHETEAPLVATGNYRAWRHFLESRASGGADPEIRETAMRTYQLLSTMEPHIFSDYAVDSFGGLETPYQKV